MAERRGVICIERSLKQSLQFARYKNNTEGLRATEVARQLTDPYGNRTGRWYNRHADYDAADRPTVETTGAGSEVLTSYTQRGTVKTVSSTYGGCRMSALATSSDADPLAPRVARRMR